MNQETINKLNQILDRGLSCGVGNEQGQILIKSAQVANEVLAQVKK